MQLTLHLNPTSKHHRNEPQINRSVRWAGNIENKLTKNLTTMDEKLLNEILTSLQKIRATMKIPIESHLAGTVADPSPEFYPNFKYPDPIFNVRGPIADPSPLQLLDKDELAKIKVCKLDRAIDDLNREIDFIKMERDLLKQQYKI
jgi:hypothetical protein